MSEQFAPPASAPTAPTPAPVQEAMQTATFTSTNPSNSNIVITLEAGGISEFTPATPSVRVAQRPSHGIAPTAGRLVQVGSSRPFAIETRHLPWTTPEQAKEPPRLPTPTGPFALSQPHTHLIHTYEQHNITTAHTTKKPQTYTPKPLTHTAYTWGNSTYGGKLQDQAKDAGGRLLSPTTKFAYAHMGNYAGVGIATDGTLYTWGVSDSGGQLQGRAKDADGRPLSPTTKFAYAHIGYKTGVGIATDGTLYTWGDSSYGGKLQGEAKDAGGRPLSATTKFAYAHMGWRAGVGIATDGTLYTWGHSAYGGKLQGEAKDADGRPLSPTTKFAYAHMGYKTGVGIATDGTLYTWGASTFGGQLQGEAKDAGGRLLSPTTKFAYAHMGWRAGVGIATDGTLYTWGASRGNNFYAGKLQYQAKDAGGRLLSPTTKFTHAHIGEYAGVALTVADSPPQTYEVVRVGLLYDPALGGLRVSSTSRDKTFDCAGLNITDVPVTLHTPARNVTGQSGNEALPVMKAIHLTATPGATMSITFGPQEAATANFTLTKEEGTYKLAGAVETSTGNRTAAQVTLLGDIENPNRRHYTEGGYIHFKSDGTQKHDNLSVKGDSFLVALTASTPPRDEMGKFAAARTHEIFGGGL